MQTVNLAKALKIKNRLVGELKRLQQILVRENSKLVGASGLTELDCIEILASIEKTISDLVSVKTRIALANVGIYGKVNKIAELKGLIAFYATVPTNDGKIKEEAGWREAPSFNEYKAVYTKVAFDKFSKEASEEIDKLQDEIDVYNTNTKVDLDA